MFVVIQTCYVIKWKMFFMKFRLFCKHLDVPVILQVLLYKINTSRTIIISCSLNTNKTTSVIVCIIKIDYLNFMYIKLNFTVTRYLLLFNFLTVNSFITNFSNIPIYNVEIPKQLMSFRL